MAKSAYIHIPFCQHKCDFCDFAAFAGLDDLSEEYSAIVVEEIGQRLRKEPNDEKLGTIFFGGGTPGYVPPHQLGNIIEALRQNSGIEADAEITLETTPHTITKEKCASWQNHGINRISIGVESLQDSELKAMGRDHTRAQAITGARIARESGYENLALDLMYGLPEQTLETWSDTLDDLLSLQPKHISAYGLTIAQNSPLLLRFPRDSEKYPDDEIFEKMYYMLVDKCAAAGLAQYEIANLSVPGYESRHNMVYWKNQEYLAFGVSAHRYYRGKRSSNFRGLKKYMREFLNDEIVEEIDADTRRKEAIFLGLRLRSGLNLAEFQENYGVDLLECKAKEIDKLQSLGLLDLDSGNLNLTQKGVLISNSVLAELI
jgi:oxygen-independent coproporphyrinogen-3 oxidase